METFLIEGKHVSKIIFKKLMFKMTIQKQNILNYVFVLFHYQGLYPLL